MYEQTYDESNSFTGVKRLSDGARIPADDGNRDWRAFSEWNAAQAQPLELSDRPPPERRVPKQDEELFAELGNLGTANRDKLIDAILADWLRQRPGRAREVGVAIDGDKAATH